jgi:hypothetical protein
MYYIKISCFSVLLFAACTGSEKKNAEAVKQDSIVTQKDTANPYRNSTTEVRTFEVDKPSSGFGYDLFIDGAQYIHQPNIPAVNGNNGFKTKEQAQKAGEFVAYKIKNNIMPPSVTPQELDSLAVLK